MVGVVWDKTNWFWCTYADRLIGLRRHVLLDRALETVGLVLAVLLLGLLVAQLVLELRVGKSSRCAGLEGATEEQLGGQKRSELHVKGGARCGHLLNRVDRGLRLRQGLGVDRGDVAAARVPVGKAADVGSEGTMRETSVAI